MRGIYNPVERRNANTGRITYYIFKIDRAGIAMREAGKPLGKFGVLVVARRIEALDHASRG
jgi:hypothetical protein